MHEIEHEFTTRKISPWGGIKLLASTYFRTGLKEFLATLPLPYPGSNRGYHPIDLIEGFMVSVVLGSRRLVHTGMLRTDEVIREIFQWKNGIGDASTFSRFFKKWDIERNDSVFKAVMRYWFDRIHLKKMTIDLDSTVITRYGHQEGAEKGYNPKKRGKRSHHPLLAMCDELKMVINAWMRTGNSSSTTDILGFMKEMFEIVNPIRIGMIRMDSGFYSGEVMNYLEEESKQCNYIIKAKLTSALMHKILSLRDWVSNDDCQVGMEYSELTYQAQGWKAPRRMIVMRKKKEKEYSEEYLFEEDQMRDNYTFQVLVTNTALSALQVHQNYNQRGDCENRIKELKYDYSIDGFSLQSFGAMEAAFRWIMVAYNLMSLLRQNVMKTRKTIRLTSIRFQCIAIGSYLVKSSRKKKLKLSAEGKRKHFLEHFFKNVEELKPPFRFSNA